MKKIILLIMAFLPIFAHAENMCVKNGSIMVVLDPQINGTALSNNATGKTWSTKFSYGVISGIGGCYSNVGTTLGGVASNQTNISAYSTGQYCYCKMLRPIESPWVYSGLYSVSCGSRCMSDCSSNAGSLAALRAGLFGNVIE